MTKSTITREQLEEWVAQFDEDGGCDATDRQLEALIRQSLAAMDSEPVAWLLSGGGTKNVVCFDSGNAYADPLREVTPLYRHAQPALVVPDGYVTVPKEPTDEMLAAAKEWTGLTSTAEAVYIKMLAAAPQSPGSEPATVPGTWIPVSERLPEDSGRYWCYVEEQNDLGKSHYQWNCSWNGDRWWVESEGGGIVTHWVPLPAAPQEVKGD